MVILALALLGPVLLGLLATYVVAVAVLIAAGYLLWRRPGWGIEADSRVLIGAFAALALLFTVTAQRPNDLVSVLNFGGFLLCVPLGLLLARASAPGNATRIAQLALLGTVLAALIALVQVFGLGIQRAEGFRSDTIRFSVTTMLLGYLALMGWQGGGRLRWIYLAGPVLAALVAVLAGARITLLGVPLVGVVALLMLVPRRYRLGALLGLLGLFAGLALLLWLGDNNRFVSLIDTLARIVSGRRVGDQSAQIRLWLYEAGWQAFLQSPLIGHGWSHMMPSVASFMSDDTRRWAEVLKHPHNEVLAFAISGGLVGVVVYAALMAMPIVVALRSPADSQKRQRLLAATLLVAGYVASGATDTMVSFEMHTMLYVTWTAIILRYCRDEPRYLRPRRDAVADMPARRELAAS